MEKKTVSLSQDQLKQIKTQYPGLYEKVHRIFLKYDPLEIHFDDDKDEYGPEIASVLPLLKNSKTEQEVISVTRQIFVDWFGESGAKDLKNKYEPIARDVWKSMKD